MDDLVIPGGNQYGEKSRFERMSDWCSDNKKLCIAMVIALIVVIIVIIVSLSVTSTEGMCSDQGHVLRFTSGRSDLGDDTNTKAADASVVSCRLGESFSSRESPQFSDVTSNTVSREARHKTAMRAISRINQSRASRASANGKPIEPLQWAAFWADWKKSHPLEGEAHYIESMTHSDSRSFEDRLSPY